MSGGEQISYSSVILTYLPTIGGILISALSAVYPSAFGIPEDELKTLNVYTVAPYLGAISTVSIFLSS
jgi:hypothetical protein